jgi:DNA-directed RNA polymerase subunit RPC12/RpoP
MATVVEFACPNCGATCTSDSGRGELVRCPECFSFITVPTEGLPQVKVPPPPPPMPMIVFRCPHCKSRIETDTANAGLACLCPGCHVELTIPGNAKPIFLRLPRNEVMLDRHRLRERLPVGMLVALLALGLALLVALVKWLQQ